MTAQDFSWIQEGPSKGERMASELLQRLSAPKPEKVEPELEPEGDLISQVRAAIMVLDGLGGINKALARAVWDVLDAWLATPLPAPAPGMIRGVGKDEAREKLRELNDRNTSAARDGNDFIDWLYG